MAYYITVLHFFFTLLKSICYYLSCPLSPTFACPHPHIAKDLEQSPYAHGTESMHSTSDVGKTRMKKGIPKRLVINLHSSHPKTEVLCNLCWIFSTFLATCRIYRDQIDPSRRNGLPCHAANMCMCMNLWGRTHLPWFVKQKCYPGLFALSLDKSHLCTVYNCSIMVELVFCWVVINLGLHGDTTPSYKLLRQIR